MEDNMPRILIYDRAALTIGMIGSDAGYWTFEDGKWVWHPGWEVERFTDLVSAVEILEVAGRLKQRGLAETIGAEAASFVHAQLGELQMGGRS
jgi:hypothetical protein